MARLNTLNLNTAPRTHEGTPARHISPEIQLQRSVLACLLWESQFYEDGVEIAGRIAELVPKVAADKVAPLAVEASEQMKLRHAPLLLVREMARHKTHRAAVSETLARVIQRADELAEFVPIRARWHMVHRGGFEPPRPKLMKRNMQKESQASDVRCLHVRRISFRR